MRLQGLCRIVRYAIYIGSIKTDQLKATMQSASSREDRSGLLDEEFELDENCWENW